MTEISPERRPISSRDFLVSNPAELTQCHRCFVDIWKAVVRGFEFKISGDVIDLEQEIALRLLGVRTFQTIRVDEGFILDLRTVWTIPGQKADSVVLAEHDCDRPTKGVTHFYAKAQRAESEEIPF